MRILFGVIDVMEDDWVVVWCFFLDVVVVLDVVVDVNFKDIDVRRIFGLVYLCFGFLVFEEVSWVVVIKNYEKFVEVYDV